MGLLNQRPRATDSLTIIAEASSYIHGSCKRLQELLSTYPEQIEIVDQLSEDESRVDEMAHRAIHALYADRRNEVLTVSEGHALMSQLDDIIDYAEQTAAMLKLYAIEAPMEQAVALAGVLVDAAEQVSQAITALRDGQPFEKLLVEAHRLENEGDTLYRDALASLFDGGIDPMVVIRWKDIFDSLEAAIDACEKTAHTLEGIGLKHGAIEPR